MPSQGRPHALGRAERYGRGHARAAPWERVAEPAFTPEDRIGALELQNLSVGDNRALLLHNLSSLRQLAPGAAIRSVVCSDPATPTSDTLEGVRAWVVALVGCTFTHGSLPSDAPSGTDASDAPAIDSAPTCIDRWLANTIRFGTPVQLAELSTSSFERDPFLVPDELTIYFSSGRSGDADVFVAKRSTVGGTFGTPTEASPFNSTANDGKLSISADNKIAVVTSDRTGSLGYDVWQSIRATSSDAWPALDRTDLALVNSTGNEYDPMLSADGTQLYLAPDSPGPQHIVVATRDSLGMFGPPTTLSQLDSSTGDADPVPSFDQRVLVFASNRPLAGAGNGDLWCATRATAMGAFGAPMPVPDVNTSLQEGDPHLSSDGCRLYFARRTGGTDYDIFLSVAQ